jgi:hypothetical protein
MPHEFRETVRDTTEYRVAPRKVLSSCQNKMNFSMVRQETARHQCAYRAVENISLTKHAIIAAQMHCHHATLRHDSV